MFRYGRRSIMKKRDKLNKADGPEALGALSRQIDDDMLVKLQDTINAGIEGKSKNVTSIFIRVSIAALGTTTSVIKRLEAFYFHSYQLKQLG